MISHAATTAARRPLEHQRIAVCAYLFTNATLLRGPLVGAISGADISVFVGLAVSFCLYLALAARSARVMHLAVEPSAVAAE